MVGAIEGSMLAVGSQLGCRWNGVHTSGMHLLSISALAPETPFFFRRLDRYIGLPHALAYG